MTAEEARQLTRESDPSQIEFYKNKPMNETDLEYCKKIFDETVRQEIKNYFDSLAKSVYYRSSMCAMFFGQWNNELLKQYALENGFNISPDGNRKDLWVTWDIRKKV